MFKDRQGFSLLLLMSLAVPVPLIAATPAQAPTPTSTPDAHPGCAGIDARQCVELAIQAVGGRAALAAITSEQTDVIGHSVLTEQSYRQAPFITAYMRNTASVDFVKGRMITESHGVWPEADPDTASAESTATVIATRTAAVIRVDGAEQSGRLSHIDGARARLELGPERLLLTAAAASDLHFETAETLRSTPHTVVAFRWDGAPVKVLINGFNHLPDATETTRTFNDFWTVWGDVAQRVYFDNWKLIGRIAYPTNRIEERNGVLWSSSQVLEAKFNVALDDKAFAMSAQAASKSAALGSSAFDQSDHVALAPGVDLYQGGYNVTFIRQNDGVLLLEAPGSSAFVKNVLAKARADNPSLPIKAVLTSSDSWPHIGGLRQAVAEKLPVYALDLNRPLLERLLSASHAQKPDDLQKSPQSANWRMIAGKTEIGTGPNRIVVYPLRGASTERQYMVYFPQHRLLYASDTLVLDPDKHALYDPELMHEVVQAADREHLQIDQVYAMHNGPVSWSEVKGLVTAAAG
jgi:hypothetical protein